MDQLHGLAAFGVVTGATAAYPVVDQFGREYLLIFKRRYDIKAGHPVSTGRPGHIVEIQVGHRGSNDLAVFIGHRIVYQGDPKI
jgi:hypothetical protein